MNYRVLGKTGLRVSEVSLGAWQLGGRWGEPFDDVVARETLGKAFDAGINFIDTADGYGEGKSERAVGAFVRQHRTEVSFATKCGRRLTPHNAAGYNETNIRRFVLDSLTNTGLKRLDLLQLHCPPTDVYYNPEVFTVLDRLVAEGKIAHYGVSVERVEEALKAIEFPGVATVQIIFNMFRQRPAELFFQEAKKKNVGILVRVPLASGLLSGKFNSESKFNKDDHRFYNRKGEAFDRGETFAGVDYDTGLDAVAALKSIFPQGSNLAVNALKWILMFPEVSCVIPGASRPEQIVANAQAAELPDFSDDQTERIKNVYNDFIKPTVHQLW